VLDRRYVCYIRRRCSTGQKIKVDVPYRTGGGEAVNLQRMLVCVCVYRMGN